MQFSYRQEISVSTNALCIRDNSLGRVPFFFLCSGFFDIHFVFALYYDDESKGRWLFFFFSSFVVGAQSLDPCCFVFV